MYLRDGPFASRMEHLSSTYEKILDMIVVLLFSISSIIYYYIVFMRHKSWECSFQTDIGAYMYICAQRQKKQNPAS